MLAKEKTKPLQVETGGRKLWIALLETEEATSEVHFPGYARQPSAPSVTFTATAPSGPLSIGYWAAFYERERQPPGVLQAYIVGKMSYGPYCVDLEATETITIPNVWENLPFAED